MNPAVSRLALLCSLLALAAACSDSHQHSHDDPLIIIDEDSGHGHHNNHNTPDMDAPDQPVSPPDMDAPDEGPAVTSALIEGPVAISSVYKSNLATLMTTGISFNPQAPDQLWLIQRWPPSDARCDSRQQTNAGCTALEGSVTIVYKPGTPEQTSERRVDPNGWHFMRRPTGLSFGAPGTFASCGEERTGNYLDDRADFIGPTLWSSDLSIFAKDPGVDANGDPLNGSHLDMLHETPFCMGIEHEDANIYWTFNGDIGSLDRYDFKADHGPGYHDHSDGELYRYAVGQLKRLPGIPSHMAYDKAAKLLYVADTGNGRVVRLDPSTGTMTGPASPVYEPLAVNRQFEGAELIEIVRPGTVTHPSGLLLHAGKLYVADNATGVIHAFELDGTPIATLNTNLAPGALTGLTVGPDGKLYFTDMLSSEVLRIDPQ